MSSKNQELFFGVIVLLLVIRKAMTPEKTPFDWAMLALGLVLLARQGYAFYQSRQ
jgi:hypothetical protein